MVEDLQSTDAGSVPNDWKAPKLSAISAFENGKAHEQFIDNKGDYIVVNSKFISTEGEVQKFCNRLISPLKKGNITIVMSDIPNGKALAKCFLIDKDNRYTLNQRIGCIKPKDEIDSQYLFYILNRNKYFLAFDSGTGQTNLKKNEILDCPIPLPPTKDEQTTIATALNDTDKLITRLEKHLAKKRNIKQGVMQELLKPQSGWLKKTIQELIDECIIISHLDGNHGELYPRNSEFKETGVPYISATDFENGKVNFSTCKFLPIERAKQFKKGVAKNGDVLFAHNATVGPVAFLKTKLDFVILSTTATYFRCDNKKLINGYLFYALQATFFSEQYKAVMLQSTRAQVPITQQRKFDLLIPSPEEQIKISTVLLDIEDEIYKLEERLDKYKFIKQGMMQNLLTGKIRLV